MHETFDIFSIVQRGHVRPCFFKTKRTMAWIKKVTTQKERWHVDYDKCSMCRLKKDAQVYIGAGDGLFSTFEEAQSYLLTILKHQHAQALADISRLSIETTAIEAKIRIVNTSSEQDYI